MHLIRTFRAEAVALAFGLCFLSLFAPAGQAAELHCDSPVISTHKDAMGERYVHGRIKIHASPKVVWESLVRVRRSDPDMTSYKVLEKGENQAIIEEGFTHIPVIGTVSCVVQDIEVPYQRIDYKLVRSNHFKTMQGSWVLSPDASGCNTVLELSTCVEMRFPAPRMIVDRIAFKKLHERLTSVKRLSEEKQLQLAER